MLTNCFKLISRSDVGENSPAYRSGGGSRGQIHSGQFIPGVDSSADGSGGGSWGQIHSGVIIPWVYTYKLMGQKDAHGVKSIQVRSYLG